MNLPLFQRYTNLFHQIVALLQPLHGRAWLVGGTLRDAWLQREPHDLDLVVDVEAIPFARALAEQLGGSFVLLDAEHLVARVVVSAQTHIDIAQQRGATIVDDLALRDFTVNALALPLLPDGTLGELHDPLGGQGDLAAGIVRLCAASAFADDPLRMLRAVRIAAIFGWQLDVELDAALRAHAASIDNVSMERIRDELLLLLATPHSAPWLRYLDRAGLLCRIFPELIQMHGETQPIVHFLDVWEHTLEAICALEWLWQQFNHTAEPPPPSPPADSADPYPPTFFQRPVAAQQHPTLGAELRWHAQIVDHLHTLINGTNYLTLLKLALLFHDVAKPATRANKPDGGVSFHGHQDLGADGFVLVGQRLRLSRAQIEHVQRIIRGHMRPGQLHDQPETSQRAVYRFFRDLDGAAVSTLVHSLADHLATRGPHLSLKHWRIHLEWTDMMLDFVWSEAEQQQKRAPLITGHTLIQALNIAPGPHIGQLLSAIQEAQAIGEISSSDEALALARRLHAEL